MQGFVIPLQKILTSEKKKVSETSEILGVRETVFEPFIILHEDQGARSTKYMYHENVLYLEVFHPIQYSDFCNGVNSYDDFYCLHGCLG